MKVCIQSDLHLEFDGGYEITNPGSDVLILAGDICNWQYFNRSDASPHKQAFKRFFDSVNKQWDHVIYIAGNHEYYRSEMSKGLELVRKFLEDYPNVHFLDNESITINGVTFIGSTLWTDLNKSNPITMMQAGDCMNDYRLITVNDYKKLQPRHTAYFHRQAVEYIQEALKQSEKSVVVTHMAPSPKSIHERFKDDYHMNFAYYTDLEELIIESPNAKLWVHGHMHNSFDYQVGETRVVCNPKGYHEENIHEFTPLKVIEI